MDDNCDYCSVPRETGDEILEEVTIWKGTATQMELKTGKWMHKPCGILKRDEDRQMPGQHPLA